MLVLHRYVRHFVSRATKKIPSSPHEFPSSPLHEPNGTLLTVHMHDFTSPMERGIRPIGHNRKSLLEGQQCYRYRTKTLKFHIFSSNRIHIGNPSNMFQLFTKLARLCKKNHKITLPGLKIGWFSAEFEPRSHTRKCSLEKDHCAIDHLVSLEPVVSYVWNVLCMYT